MSLPRTTIIIVNWNTREMLRDCLESVAAHCAGAIVVVIDNASTDGSVDALAPEFPGFAFTTNEENLGFARANNQGLRDLATPYAWLLNPDTVVHAGALAALERHLDDNAGVAVVGAALLNTDGTPQPCSFGFPTPLGTWAEWLYLPRPLARARDRLFDLAPRRVAGPTDWVLGAAMLVRRDAMETVGVLDDGFFMYAEELDWCRRFRAAGWGVHLVPEAVVTHHGGASTKQVPEAMRLELFRSRARYFRRNMGWARWAAFAPLMWVGAAWNALYLLVRPQPGVHLRTPWAIARAAATGLAEGGPEQVARGRLGTPAVGKP